MSGKTLFFQLWPKVFSTNQLLLFFDHPSLWKEQITQIFHMEIIIKRMQDLSLLLLVECGQLCLLSNQIAGFFDHQYLRKESIDILVFCIEIFIKESQHPRLPLLVEYAQLCLFSNQVEGVYDHQYSQKESNGTLLVFYEDNHEGTEATTFGQVWPVVPLIQ